MRRVVRQMCRRTVGDGGFSLASLLVAMAVLGLVAGLSTAAVGSAFDSTASLRTTVSRTVDATRALDYLAAVAGPGIVVSADQDTLTVSTDEQGSCTQHIFAIEDDNGDEVAEVTHESLTLALPSGGRCADISDSGWVTAWGSAPTSKDTLATSIYSPSEFTYFAAGNSEMTTPITTPGGLCAVARITVSLTVRGTQDDKSEVEVTESIPVTRQAFGVECP